MCDITIKRATEIIQGFKSLDSGNHFSDKDLANLYLKTYQIKKEFEDYEKNLKQILIEKNIDDQIFPEEEKKVFLEEGRKSSSFEIGNIINDCLTENLLTNLSEVITINQTSLKESLSSELKGICEKYKKEIPGNITVKIKNMTKKELMEQGGN